MMNPDKSGQVISFSDGLRNVEAKAPTLLSPISGLGQFDLYIYTTRQLKLRQGVDGLWRWSIDFNKTLVGA